jgi:hypothetical protein
MEAKPLEHSPPPAYPTRREVLAGVVSFAVVGLTGGCGSSEAGGAAITVAPVFKHGEGRGADGCVVVAPPVFLSEEEALQVLREELAKHGIKLKAGLTLSGVRMPARSENHEVIKTADGREEVKHSIVEVAGPSTPLKVDGFDEKHKVAVQFVSEHRYDDLGGFLVAPLARSLDFHEVAEHVAATVKKQAKDHVFYGVFYDPVAERHERRNVRDNIDVQALIKYQEEHGKEEFEKLLRQQAQALFKRQEEHGKEESKKLLRQQADDFVAWLKTQKAIP